MLPLDALPQNHAGSALCGQPNAYFFYTRASFSGKMHIFGQVEEKILDS